MTYGGRPAIEPVASTSISYLQIISSNEDEKYEESLECIVLACEDLLGLGIYPQNLLADMKSEVLRVLLCIPGYGVEV